MDGRPVGVAELNLLDRLAPHAGAGSAQHYRFSRSGFSDRLVDRAELDPALTLLTHADIYR